MTMPASRIERAECEPPPSLTMSVSNLEDVDVVERHAEPFGDALGKRGFVALPARQRADHDIDPALRLHGDVGALARIAAGRFQIVAQPDAAQFACVCAPRRGGV